MKTLWDFILLHFEQLRSREETPTSAGEDAGKGEPAGAAMAEISMEGTKKLNTELPCDQLYHPWA